MIFYFYFFVWNRRGKNGLGMNEKDKTVTLTSCWFLDVLVASVQAVFPAAPEHAWIKCEWAYGTEPQTCQDEPPKAQSINQYHN